MKYKIKNWAEYNKSLVNRGRITFWFREEVIEEWINEKRNGKKGRPKDLKVYGETKGFYVC